MKLKQLLPIFSYLLIVGFGLGNQFAHPQRIAVAASWELFTTPPPETIEQESHQELRSNLAPTDEIILTVSGDMILTHVNKIFALPSSYVPPKLTKITSISTSGNQYLRKNILPYLYQLFGAAEEAGFNLTILSAYRSYFHQEATFWGWVKRVGWEAATRGSAYPGHSEHQLGTTVDLALASNLDFKSFSLSPAAGWVAKNAHRFGFTVSYQKGKESITGYIHEPWHIRWVGENLATELYRKGITLEEYFSQ